ncbi:hypothetical protein FB446DRAFT_349228 [Lentinula raphanica]|nr:hypothetical protein FB446DRAFT_349228 [Lentinula raphanica]
MMFFNKLFAVCILSTAFPRLLASPLPLHTRDPTSQSDVALERRTVPVEVDLAVTISKPDVYGIVLSEITTRKRHLLTKDLQGGHKVSLKTLGENDPIHQAIDLGLNDVKVDLHSVVQHVQHHAASRSRCDWLMYAVNGLVQEAEGRDIPKSVVKAIEEWIEPREKSELGFRESTCPRNFLGSNTLVPSKYATPFSAGPKAVPNILPPSIDTKCGSSSGSPGAGTSESVTLCLSPEEDPDGIIKTGEKA